MSGSALDKIKSALENTAASKPYYFGKTVTFVTRSGKVLDEDALKKELRSVFLSVCITQEKGITMLLTE